MAVLGLIVPGLSREMDWQPGLLALAIFFMAAWFLHMARASATFDLFEPLNLVFFVFVVMFPLRAIRDVLMDTTRIYHSSSLLLQGLFAAILGFSAFAAGYRTRIGTRAERLLASWLDGDLDIGRVNVVSFVYLLISVIGFIVLLNAGGSVDYFLSLDPDIKSPWAMKYWFFYVLWTVIFVQVAALLQLAVWFSRGRQAVLALAYFLVGLSAAMLVSRLVTLAYLLMAMILFHYLRRKIGYVGVVLMTVLLVTYIVAAGLYRDLLSLYAVDVRGQEWKELLDVYFMRGLDHLYTLTDLMYRMPGELPFQWGLTFTTIFLKPVPRAWLPYKPMGATSLITYKLYPKLYDLGFSPAASAWGEWFLNFSWAGIIGGMTLMGMMASAFYHVVRGRPRPARVLTHGVLMVFLLVWLRSDFNAACTTAFYYGIPLVAAFWCVIRPHRGRVRYEGEPQMHG